MTRSLDAGALARYLDEIGERPDHSLRRWLEAYARDHAIAVLSSGGRHNWTALGDDPLQMAQQREQVVSIFQRIKAPFTEAR